MQAVGTALKLTIHTALCLESRRRAVKRCVVSRRAGRRRRRLIVKVMAGSYYVKHQASLMALNEMEYRISKGLRMTHHHDSTTAKSS